jgi:hypothetical protein
MNLYEKIKAIYPDLEDSYFAPISGTIKLQNDGDEDYIKEWNHPTLSRPTDEQLNGVN